MQHSIFFRQFLLNPKYTGAITSSSQKLSELITTLPDLSAAKTVVELGSGTGAFTQKILQNISPHTVFFALETNEVFVRSAREQFLHLNLYHDSAIKLPAYLAKHGVKNADVIISGLPWVCFHKKFQENLLQIVAKSLKNGGEFLTFAYLHGLFLPRGKYFKRLLHRYFSSVTQTRVVWRNFPPAIVYHCIK